MFLAGEVKPKLLRKFSEVFFYPLFICGNKNIFGPKKFGSKENIGYKKICSTKMFGFKKKMLAWKYFGLKMMLLLKDNFWVRKTSGPQKKYGPKKILSPKKN